MNFFLDVDPQPSAEIQKSYETIGDLLPEIFLILDAVGLHGLGQFGDDQHQGLADIPFLVPKTFLNGHAVAQMGKFIQRFSFDLNFGQ